MKQFFGKLRLNLLIFIVALIFVLAGWFWSYLALREATLPLILHFSNFSGINQVGYVWDLSKVALFGTVVVALNFLITRELEKRDRFLSRLTSAVTLFLGILIFIYFAAIISVNN